VKEVEHGGKILAYIEVTKADIALANEIAHEVLGRTLDELPPQTRRLLSLLQPWVIELAKTQGVAAVEVRFTRREVRDVLKWGDTQLKLHLSRLVDLEYLMLHRSGTTYEYELVYDGNTALEAGSTHLSGLINASLLDYDSERSGVNLHRSDLGVNRSGQGRPNVGPMSGGGRGGKNTDFSYEESTNSQKNAKTHVY
jgi:hypothetical protein